MRKHLLSVFRGRKERSAQAPLGRYPSEKGAKCASTSWAFSEGERSEVRKHLLSVIRARKERSAQAPPNVSQAKKLFLTLLVHDDWNELRKQLLTLSQQMKVLSASALKTKNIISYRY